MDGANAKPVALMWVSDLVRASGEKSDESQFRFSGISFGDMSFSKCFCRSFCFEQGNVRLIVSDFGQG